MLYRNLTIQMKRAEKIIAALALLGISMNLLLIHGGGLVTILSLSSLSCFYFYLSFAFFNDVRLRNIRKADAFKDISRNRVIGAIALGLALGMDITGLLFHFQSYPGAQFNLIIGLIAISIIGIVALIKYVKNRLVYYTKIFKRIAIYGGLSIIILCIPKSAWIDIKYRNHPTYRDALEKAIADPNNPKLWKTADSIRDNMEKKGEI